MSLYPDCDTGETGGHAWGADYEFVCGKPGPSQLRLRWMGQEFLCNARQSAQHEHIPFRETAEVGGTVMLR